MRHTLVKCIGTTYALQLLYVVQVTHNLWMDVMQLCYCVGGMSGVCTGPCCHVA
jgi:hypothetical protein